ncbi:sulfite exporter TauE/SafE family protein [Herbaspirillum sp. HC18]|nr:sulfite exporter TauE/SafE family protein [Herbaspirillum sp. HC18]
MTDLHLLPVFMIGLLGGVHCIGMCGGIVGAFSVASARRTIPIHAASGAGAVSHAATFDDAARVFAYNAGRLSSYAIAGAIAGGVAQGVRTLSFVSSLQIGGYWLANLMLIALGLYLMGVWRGLAYLEAGGQVVWRRVQPLVRHLLPVDNVGKAFALGGLWGWVPCGMVYSVLLTAMLSGSATSGAMVMLAFGAGTLPVLVTMGMLGSRLQGWTRRRGVRIASGMIVLAFGLLGLIRAGNGLSLGWLDTVCITPPPTGIHAGGR